MKARRKAARLSAFERARAWVMATGLMLIGWYFGEALMGEQPDDRITMLATAIGGFELALYGNDLWRGRRRRNG